MIRQVRHAIMIISIVAIAITASCYTDLENDFQQLESTDSDPVKLVNVTDANNVSANKIYDNKKVAQKITIPAGQSFQLQGAQIKLKRFGDFSTFANPEVRISVHLTDPAAAAIVYSARAKAVEIPESDPVDTADYIPFEFSLKPPLTEGNTYWIVLHFVEDTDGSATDYIEYFDDDLIPQSFQYYNGTDWINQAGNMGIVIWGRPMN